MKELTIQEVFNYPVGTEFIMKREDGDFKVTLKINKSINRITLIMLETKLRIELYDSTVNAKFILIENRKVNFIEAYKAYQEGKIIESCEGSKYKEINGCMNTESSNGTWHKIEFYLSENELHGEWIVREDLK
jgi:hypothetical protein